jgi:hypothetical protein
MEFSIAAGLTISQLVLVTALYLNTGASFEGMAELVDAIGVSLSRSRGSARTSSYVQVRILFPSQSLTKQANYDGKTKSG